MLRTEQIAAQFGLSRKVSDFPQPLQRAEQRLILLGKAEAHHALVEAVAVEGRQRDGGDAISLVSHLQKSASFSSLTAEISTHWK